MYGFHPIDESGTYNSSILSTAVFNIWFPKLPYLSSLKLKREENMEDPWRMFLSQFWRWHTSLLIFHLWKLSHIYTHGGVLLRSPFNIEDAWRNSVSWQPPAAIPVRSITAFKVRPGRQFPTSDWARQIYRALNIFTQCRMYLLARFVLGFHTGLTKT